MWRTTKVKCKSMFVLSSKTQSLAPWKYWKSTDFKEGNLEWLKVLSRRKEMLKTVENKFQKELCFKDCLK